LKAARARHEAFLASHGISPPQPIVIIPDPDAGNPTGGKWGDYTRRKKRTRSSDD
jgi:hypothetical protein